MTETPDYHVDVAILSDFRLPGGTTASIAEEVRAQSAAGVSTALVHITGSVTNYPLPWSQHMRRVVGLPHVQLATAHSRLHARVLIIRHPTVILSTRHNLHGITADRVVVIANHAAIDAGGIEHYNIEEADAKVRRIFGTEPIWAPIGPVVRGTMLQQTTKVAFREADWVNVFPLHEEITPRTAFVAGAPVIGRHSRPQPGKWPATARDILAAYPDSPDYRVRILGGAQVAEKLLGQVPKNWEVIPFGGAEPSEFLREIDFWVYMHHPDLKEAFGRAAMEALAAGCVAIMPPYMEELFGSAALYSTPSGVRALVDEYSQDLSKFLAQSRRAQEFAQGFSPQMHVERLRELGVDTGQPSTAASASESIATQVESLPGARAVVILDGETPPGIGDRWTGLLQAHPELLIVTVGESPLPHLPSDQALFIPSQTLLNMEEHQWEGYFLMRLQHLFSELEAERVGYLGATPHNGLLRALDSLPARKVWLRSTAPGDTGSAGTETSLHAEASFHHLVDAAAPEAPGALGLKGRVA